MQSSNDSIPRRTLLGAAAVPFAAVASSAANSAVSIGLLGAGRRGPARPECFALAGSEHSRPSHRLV